MLTDMDDYQAASRYGVNHAPVLRGLRRYVTEGIPPGGFLTSVLENDLWFALEVADDSWTIESLRGLVSLIHCETPSRCHGSYAKVTDWISSHIERREREVIAEARGE